MLDINSKLQKFASGYRQTPSNDERRELEKLASEIVRDIMAGKLPTPEGLAAFHGFEVVADTPLNYPNYPDALMIIQTLTEAVGNDPKLINDYNLVLHAAYLQRTDLVRRLIDVEGVEINKAVQGIKIRGESPLTVAGAIIDNANSRQIFDLIADRLPNDGKSNQGNWVSWAFSKYNLEEIVKVNERLEAFSDIFEIQPEMALKAATPLLGVNRNDPKEIWVIQEYFERVLENMSDIKDHELFFRTNLGGLIAGVLLEQDSEIQPHRKELIAKLALLSDVKISDELSGESEFAKKLLKIHDAMLEMSEKDKATLRDMIKHPSEHMFGNLVDIVFNEEKLADFCNKLSNDKALYKLFMSRANAIPYFKPFVEVIEMEVQSLLKTEVGTESKGAELIRRISSVFRVSKNAIEEPVYTKETEEKLFSALSYIDKDTLQRFFDSCERYADRGSILPNGFIPSEASARVDVMKNALVKIYDAWYRDSVQELTKLQDRELLENFTKNYENLKLKLDCADVKTLVEMSDNLERTIGTHVKRQRDRMTRSESMSVSTDSLSSSSSSTSNSPRGRWF